MQNWVQFIAIWKQLFCVIFFENLLNITAELNFNE